MTAIVESTATEALERAVGRLLVLQSPDGDTLFITQAAGASIDDLRRAAATATATKEPPVEETNEQT